MWKYMIHVVLLFSMFVIASSIILMSWAPVECSSLNPSCSSGTIPSCFLCSWILFSSTLLIYLSRLCWRFRGACCFFFVWVSLSSVLASIPLGIVVPLGCCWIESLPVVHLGAFLILSPCMISFICRCVYVTFRPRFLFDFLFEFSVLVLIGREMSAVHFFIWLLWLLLVLFGLGNHWIKI